MCSAEIGNQPEAYFALGKTSLFIRQYLRKSDLDRAEQNNLIFYVILATCAVQFRSFDITPNYLKNLNTPSVDVLEGIVAASKQIFDDAGGDAKVAKTLSLQNYSSNAFLSMRTILMV